MQRIGVIATLMAIGAGFSAGGLLGVLTAAVAAIGTFSGLAILLAESGTGVDSDPSVRRIQQIGGLLSAAGCVAGAFYGGWQYGWLWALGGYATGVALMLVIAWAIRS